MRSVVGALAASFALLGCQWLQEKPRAPLQGGETLVYALRKDNVGSRGTLTFEVKDRGFIVKASSSGYPPQRLGPDLRDPFRSVGAFELGVLWLPVDQHDVGRSTFAGQVVRHATYDGRTLTVVREPSGLVDRYFDRETGFLVALQSIRFPAFRYAQLTSTTIPGLQVTVVPDLERSPRTR